MAKGGVRVAWLVLPPAFGGLPAPWPNRRQLLRHRHAGRFPSLAGLSNGGEQRGGAIFHGTRGLLAVLLLLALPALAAAADFYVSPTGSPSGDGSPGNPWDLQTALNQPSAVHPGDTIWLRGGTYPNPSPHGPTPWFSHLTGTAAAPIILRQYPGERATLDGGDSQGRTILKVSGSYGWYWGFEVMSSDPVRQSIYTGSYAPDIMRGTGIDNDSGPLPGNKFINLAVHDTAEGFGDLSGFTGSEISGCLIYYNGWNAPDRGHGHGIYAQTTPPDSKTFKNNILFAQFDIGFQAYGSGGAPANNMYLEGNTDFMEGTIRGTGIQNIYFGGGTDDGETLISNYTYTPQSGTNGHLEIGTFGGFSNTVITNNYFAAPISIYLGTPATNLSMNGNSFYGVIAGFQSSDYPNNTYYTTRPTGVNVFVRPNDYEAGRANITIYNWDLASTVSVDLSSVLTVGSPYEIRNAQDFFAAPVLTGTYDGNPLTIPMTGLTVATPVGWTAPLPTGPEFNAFVAITPLAPFTFYDVPRADSFFPFVYIIAKNGITAGCGPGYFCPDGLVTRAQMAVFLLKGEHGSAYVPPTAVGVFADVPPGAFAADWIEQLYSEGITGGCLASPLLYCPDQAVTRAQMAVFLLRAEHGIAYTPPACTGVFADVPCTPTPAFAADWIEQLHTEGVTGGCTTNPLRYCPDNPNTRAQMAVFLVKTFQLQ